MNEQTIKLIQQIADKLGTTAEHLWSVLIRQAPIYSITGLMEDVAFFLLCFFMWKWISKIQFDNWDSDFGKGAVYAVALVISAFFFFAIGSNLSLEMAGFFNPEYWALKQVMP